MTDVEEVLSLLGTGRRRPDDSFFTEGDIVCQIDRRLGVFDLDDEELCHEVMPVFDCSIPGCLMSFDSVFAFDQHYNSVHHCICSECKKQLPSPHILDLHLSETHDSYFLAQAERKPMYRCFLEYCVLVSANAQERRHHCIADHKFPHDFRFDDARKHKRLAKTKPSGSTTDQMETDCDPSSNTSARKKSGQKKTLKKSALVETAMWTDNIVTSSSSSIDKGVSTGIVNDGKKVPSQNKPKPFSFGRGGRAGFHRGGSNWFNVQSLTPKRSTLETTLVDDLRSSLPEPMA